MPLLRSWNKHYPRQLLETSRYSHSEVHLAELITHAALAERQREAAAIGGAGSASVVVREKRRRLETSPVVARSPLDEVEEHSRNDPEWAAVHHRQALFLQVLRALPKAKAERGLLTPTLPLKRAMDALITNLTNLVW